MIISMVRKVLAAILFVVLVFSVVWGQSAELMEAFNSYQTLYQQGRYSEAEPYAKEAIRLSTEELGPEHPHTAAFINNLAVLYQAQGKYVEAEPLYQRALEIREKVLGKEHPHVAAKHQAIGRGGIFLCAVDHQTITYQ